MRGSITQVLLHHQRLLSGLIYFVTLCLAVGWLPCTCCYLLTSSTQSTTPQLSDTDNILAEMMYITAGEPQVNGGSISGSPPAILDNWLHLQRAIILGSIDNNGNDFTCVLTSVSHFVFLICWRDWHSVEIIWRWCRWNHRLVSS